MNILILGANGFIGSAVLSRLLMAGHAVTGLGRDTGGAARRFPAARWIRADLATLQTPENWADIIGDQEIVINCAGALQDGLCDDLAATQGGAMIALYHAATIAGTSLIVQISARTDGQNASLPFLATKARADQALKAAGIAFVIFRPALVIGRNAHGGTTLLRALAALPFVTPLVLGESPIATVALDDVVRAVEMAIAGDIAPSSDLDLADADTIPLRQLVALHRAWLGLRAQKSIDLPSALAGPVSLAADFAGRLGWRSPLRSTAMAMMREGVLSTGAKPAMAFVSAGETLAANPAGVQDLWSARLYLLKPVLVVTLALFWFLSGLIALLGLEAAAAHFLPFMGHAAAIGLTVATSLIDMTLGLLTLYRPKARAALAGQIVLASAYLLGGGLVEPQLWLDPLGPFVKVLPAMLLSLITLAILDER